MGGFLPDLAEEIRFLRVIKVNITIFFKGGESRQSHVIDLQHVKKKPEQERDLCKENSTFHLPCSSCFATR
jgi:hypothetical protein